MMYLTSDVVKKAQNRFNVKYLDSVKTPFGHILSIIVEELGETNPNLEKMVADINEQICVGGNGHAQVKTLHDEMNDGDKKMYGIFRYLNELYSQRKLKKKQYERLFDRIRYELVGVIPDDLVERNNSEKYKLLKENK